MEFYLIFFIIDKHQMLDVYLHQNIYSIKMWYSCVFTWKYDKHWILKSGPSHQAQPAGKDQVHGPLCRKSASSWPHNLFQAPRVTGCHQQCCDNHHPSSARNETWSPDGCDCKGRQLLYALFKWLPVSKRSGHLQCLALDRVSTTYFLLYNMLHNTASH